MSAFDEAKLI